MGVGIMETPEMLIGVVFKTPYITDFDEGHTPSFNKNSHRHEKTTDVWRLKSFTLKKWPK